MDTPTTLQNLLDSMLLIQSQTVHHSLHRAMHQFKVSWTDFSHDTPIDAIAIRRMNDVFEDTLTEFTFTVTYLVEHSASFLHRGRHLRHPSQRNKGKLAPITTIQDSDERAWEGSNTTWHAALSHNQPAKLVETLSNNLINAKDFDQRAIIRDEAASQFLSFHQSSNNLVVLLNLIFESHSKDEFNAQLKTSPACQRVHTLSQQELVEDRQRARDREDVSTARCTTVENWGFEFLYFAATHEWFNRVDSPYKKFWREARSASNRVKDWQAAKSMLNCALLYVHLEKKDWNAVIDQGYWTMVKTQDLLAIHAGAPRLSPMIISRLRLKVDQDGSIDFTNWMQIVSAARTAETSSQACLEITQHSSVSLATSDVSVAQGVNVWLRQNGHVETKMRVQQEHLEIITQSLHILNRWQVEQLKKPKATDRTRFLTFDQHNLKQKPSMMDTLDASDNDLLSEEDMLDRDKLYHFALSKLLCLDDEVPQLAVEWNSSMPAAQRVRADILSLSDREAVHLVSSGESIDKPFVIRGEPPDAPRLDWLLEALNDEYGPEAELDVQGDGTEAQAHRESLENVCKLLRQEYDAKRPGDFMPTNCLNIPIQGFFSGVSYANVWLFQKRSVIVRGLLGTSAKTRSRLRSVTICITDAWNCTWVKCLSGIKAWYFIIPNSDLSNMHDPMPEDIRLIILEPGHTFYMPAGIRVPHAVITLKGPCLMVGGQRLDRHNLKEQLEAIHEMILEPETTNEVVPWTQFRAILLDIVAQINLCPSKFSNSEALSHQSARVNLSFIGTVDRTRRNQAFQTNRPYSLPWAVQHTSTAPATEDSVNRSSTADNGSSSGTSHTCSHGRHATSARAVAQSALDISPRSTPGFSSNDIGGSSPELVAVDTRDSSPELNPIATGDSSPELVSADTRDSSSELNPINTGENSEASPTCTALVLYQEISHLPTHGFGHNSESVGTGSQSANLIAHNARITSILDLPNEILYQILRSSDAGPSQCGALVATCKRFESVLTYKSQAERGPAQVLGHLNSSQPSCPMGPTPQTVIGCPINVISFVAIQRAPS
ncbi:hypothetical protein KCU93_g379, partial [Aureobasidium melanogenum]